MARGLTAVLGSLGLGLALGLTPCGALAQTKGAEPGKSQDAKASEAPTQDTLIFRNGNVLTGTIVSETETTIKFKSSASGIAFETEYQKSEILNIKRAGKASAAPAGGADKPGDTPKLSEPKKAEPKPEDIASADAVKIYWIPLRGIWGEDISQTPILQAVKDAKAQHAQVLVLELDTKPFVNPRSGEPLDEKLAWDMTSRVEQIFPVFTEELPKMWDGPTPRVVMVVKRAVGGAAFMPLGFKEIYFRSDGLMGGIGDLSEIFGSTGDDVVREKQRSLRLGHVEGWAVYGKHDFRIVRAMSRREYVLSMRLVGGKAELIERMPQDASEELLTDDGKNENQDTMQQVVQGTGNDVLTMNARVAGLLGFSNGTVDNDSELLSSLGLERNGVIDRDRGERIMKQWGTSLENAKTRLRKLIDEYREIRVEPPADYDARTKARGQQKSKLSQMKSILEHFDEGLSFWARFNGMPGIPQLETMIKELELSQSLDKKEKK